SGATGERARSGLVSARLATTRWESRRARARSCVRALSTTDRGDVMDDTTMRLGLLMEAAQAHQKAAESSLKKMKVATHELAEVVRQEVHRVVVEQFHCLEADSKRASDALRALGRAANVRTLIWSVGITTLCSAISLSLVGWLIPS